MPPRTSRSSASRRQRTGVSLPLPEPVDLPPKHQHQDNTKQGRQQSVRKLGRDGDPTREQLALLSPEDYLERGKHDHDSELPSASHGGKSYQRGPDVAATCASDIRPLQSSRPILPAYEAPMPRQMASGRHGTALAIGALLFAAALVGAARPSAGADTAQEQALAALKALRPNGSGRTNYGLVECQPGSCLAQQRLYHARFAEIVRRYSVPMDSSVFDRLFPQVETIAARVDAGEVTANQAERLVQEAREANSNLYLERERQRRQAEQQNRFEVARYECQRDAIAAIPRRIAPPPPRCPRGFICTQDSPEFRQGSEDGAVQQERQQLFDSCMRARGFR